MPPNDLGGVAGNRKLGQMADNADVQASEQTKPRGVLSLVMWLLVAVVSIGSGAATPLFVKPLLDDSAASKRSEVVDSAKPPTFIEFGEVVVNLNESNLNRYLRVKISLLADSSHQSEINKLIEQNAAILRSWLLSYLADKGMNDIRGAPGQNRLRREILNHFNSVLYPNGNQRIRNILFEEFNIQ